MAIITTKYSLGDVVYLIRRNRREDWESCGFCAAEGMITGADGKKKSCPECWGKKGKTTYHEMLWAVISVPDGGRLTIGQYGFTKSRRQEEERYMAQETGIGSGSLYYVADLWPSLEEAQAECDRRNAGLPDG